MITADAIKKIAIAKQTTELNIAREYAQHLFLSGFYQQRGTQQVMFKGGTALRLIHGSPRFSEELDFSGFGVTVGNIEDWVASAAGELESNAISVSLAESKKTSGGYLGILSCPVHDMPVQIQIQISLRRRNHFRGRGVLLTPDLVPAYTLTQLPDQLLVEEKLK